jgi:hypothetical protein
VLPIISCTVVGIVSRVGVAVVVAIAVLVAVVLVVVVAVVIHRATLQNYITTLKQRC